MMEILEELALIKKGDEAAMERLLSFCKPLVNSIARKYFLVGAGTDDIVQEGMIGLYKAITTYKQGEAASFKTYASVCVRRQIVSAIRSAANNKNLPLNTYFSINNQGMIVVSSAEEEGDEEKGIYISSTSLSPEESLIGEEAIAEVYNKINKLLSGFEKKVIELYIDGLNYVEIAKRLHKDPKSIDNALGRIKTKLR
ncbi:MAG: sigma-70 family RNA polymerase sigma factor [Christensenellaceae bacterium]|jgi:RNA polymerase sporulation-specific sigma factor|nr:sigma-70 family RNA polymerase sigma factor [Christensenellaceae bacterium]